MVSKSSAAIEWCCSTPSTGCKGERVNVGFFADAGSAWLADEADFDLQVSGGLGLHRDYFRLYIARPVSNQTRDLDVSLRFSRAF